MTKRDDDAFRRYGEPESMKPAGPGRRLPSRSLSAHVPIRFRPETIDRIKQIAAASNMSVSAWVRSVVEDAVRRASPVPHTSGTTVYNANIVSIDDERSFARESREPANFSRAHEA